MEVIESTILKNLVTNESYMRKVIPYVKPEYFIQYSDKILFDTSIKYSPSALF